MPSGAEEHTSPAAERLVERVHVDAGKQTSEVRLTTVPATPHLPDHPTVGKGCTVFLPLSLEEGDDLPVASLDGEQTAGIEDDGHAAPRFLRGFAGAVRTTTARACVRRVASLISSSVISPCAAS